MKMRKAYIAAGMAVMTALLAAGCTAGTSSEVVMPSVLDIRQSQEDDTVTVQSRETVMAVPDVAEVSISVYTEDPDAAKCQQKNEESLSKTLEYLKSQGLEEGSIQTSGYSLNPRYNWTEAEGQVLTGYEMITQVTVVGIPMEKVGDILGGSVAAGANSIDYVKYMCSDYDAVYQEALKKAVTTAKTKAEAMGEAGGFQVLEVTDIQEYGENQTARYANTKEAAVEAAAAADFASMSVEAGELEIAARLTVSFKIVPR